MHQAHGPRTGALRARIAASQLGPEANLTASLGAAMLGEGESVEAWVSRADASLYRAKSLGRDRACVHGDERGQTGSGSLPTASGVGPDLG